MGGEWYTGSGRSGIFKLENEEFWPALKVLEHCHVVEWAVYTTNGKPMGEYDCGRVAKPVGVVRNGRLQTQAPESKPGLLAYMIGRAHQGSFSDTAAVVRGWGESNSLMAIENAIRAGYSKRTARSQGQRLLTNVDIAEAIQKAMAERTKFAGLRTSDHGGSAVLRRLHALGNFTHHLVAGWEAGRAGLSSASRCGLAG